MIGKLQQSDINSIFFSMKKTDFYTKFTLVYQVFAQKKGMKTFSTEYFGIVFSAILLFLTPSVLEAQSLQWSQFTAHANSTNSQTYAIEKVPNGAIYTLSTGNTGGSGIPTPQFLTTDVVLYGQMRAGSSFTYLSKYSADGSTLLWVRVLLPSSQIGATCNTEPLDLALTAAGEPVVLYVTRGSAVGNGLVTPDGWQATPPNFTQSNILTSGISNNQSAVLTKFSASGNVIYGTYIGLIGGSFYFDQTPTNSGSYQHLQVGSDGSVYVSFVTSAQTDQTGLMPTTANALSTTKGSGNVSASNILIFKPDNTLAYSTYIAVVGSRVPAIDQVIAPNGDYYVAFENPRTTDPLGLTLPSNAAIPLNTKGGLVVRFDKNGNIVNSTYLPNGIINPNNSNSPKAISARPNSNILVANLQGDIIELTPDLTTIIEQYNPFGFDITSGAFCQINDIGIDDVGRIHFTSETSIPLGKPKSISAGALQIEDATVTQSNGYYGIIDCNLKKLVYGTQITNTSNATTTNRTVFFQDIEIEGCTAYISGRSTNGLGFPVTKTAYNDAGTATVSGYDITPSVTSGGNSDGVLFAFNYPVQKANTNVLTAPAITNFCKGSGILPIDGTKTTFITPTVLGKANSNPAPTPTHYQWQVKQGAGGTYADIANSDKEDFSPTAPSVSGQYFYRRLVRQTPFGQGFCAPTCDETDISNEIALTFTSDITHKTDIPEKPYGLCAGSSLPLTYNLSPSVDGVQAPYTYKLTSTADLTTTVMGQSGSLATAPSPINLTVTLAGEYILQVTDNRGCVSFDTLIVKALALNVVDTVKFTCGAPSVKLGVKNELPVYVNYPTPTIAWTSATGLDAPLSIAPVFTHGLAVGDSVTKLLTFNGCIVNYTKVKQSTVLPLVALPDRFVCQGDTVHIGLGLVSQTGVSYEWAPGLGLTSTTAIRPTMTSVSAPVGVNQRIYYLKADNGSCVQYDSQRVTVYRYPNQSFQNKECLENGCSATIPLSHGMMGNPSEPGITYEWSVVIIPKTATTGVPTVAEALASIVSPTSSMTTILFTSGSIGKANATYEIQYIRRSYNAAASALNPTCERRDTAFLSFCCGEGESCNAALGALPAVSCGGPNNLIGPKQYLTGGTYVWSRVDGQPLNNELFDPATKLPLVNGGPHSNQAIADPTGLIAVNYNLRVFKGDDTCRIDLRVFPSAAGKPNVNYASPQYSCQATSYTMAGPAANPGLTYAWGPKSMLNDTTIALPTTTALLSNTTFYVTVYDASTTCSIIDTILIVPTLSDVEAGQNGTYCATSASTVNIGSAAKAGLTYQWTSNLGTVTFANATASQTTAVIPSGAPSPVLMYLKATNSTTAQNCMVSDTVTFTSSTLSTLTLPTPDSLCTTAGSMVTIGPVPNADYTYTWAASAGGSISGASNIAMIKALTVGTYALTITQGSCTKALSTTVRAALNPSVTAGPFTAPCATPLNLAVTNLAGAGISKWQYTWDNYTGVVSSATNQSSISVYPTVATTYTLTATHPSGCVKTFPFTVPAATYRADLPATLDICEGSGAPTLPLNTLPLGGTVTWTATPASATAYLNSTMANNPSIDMAAIPEGSYIYTATVSYGAGCVSTASITVRIGKKVQDIAGDDQIICSTTTTKIGTTQKTGYSYEWTASPIDTALKAIYSAQPTVKPNVLTTYTLKYASVTGCILYDEVIVNPSRITPTLEVLSDSMCQNLAGTATFDLASTIVTNTGATTTYWSDSKALLPTVNPTTIVGRHYIKTTSSDGFCSVTMPVTIGLDNSPEYSISSTYDCGLNNGFIQISGFPTGAKADYTEGVTYTGSATYTTATAVSGAGIVASNLVVPTLSSKTYTVRVFNATGCYTDKTVVVSAAACPTIDLKLTLTVDSPSVSIAGRQVVFTIKINNDGTGNATGVKLKVSPSVGFSFVASNAGADYNATTGILTVGKINAGTSKSFTMTLGADSVGVNYLNAEITAADQPDINSIPNNGAAGENDMASACVSVPVLLCVNNSYAATLPSGLTGIKWFKNNVEIAGQTGLTLTITNIGNYTFTANEATCPVTGCCPIKVIQGPCPIECKPIICLPVTVTKF
jgi:large repetitive protein